MAGRASAALCVKYGCADLIGQRATMAPDQDYDFRRSKFFFAFGAYYGVINYYVFRFLAWSPWPRAPWPKALYSALFDGFVNVPVGLYPQFYFVKEYVTSDGSKDLRELFEAGLAKYRANFQADVLTSAAVFVPLGIVNFRFVPLVWRTPVLSFFGMVFPIALSMQRGAPDVDN
jgi:hypothetical protein